MFFSDVAYFIKSRTISQCLSLHTLVDTQMLFVRAFHHLWNRQGH